MTHDAFRMEEVSVRFGRKLVLDRVSLELEPGGVTVLLGQNGAGKSTLLRVGLGVEKIAAGTVRVAGHDPFRAPRRVRERLGYVPDKPDACEWMTLAELLRFLQPQYPRWNAQLAHTTAEALAVPMHTRFKSLSRGEGMKAMLVAALAPEPEVLLLDEPFSGLDPLAREDVLRGVIGALREGRRTVLCATHELDVASRIADRVAILAGGKVARHGTLEEILGSEPVSAPERLHDELRAAVAAEVRP
jgi:ABC-2 type transport system ATP-binding protein